MVDKLYVFDWHDTISFDSKTTRTRIKDVIKSWNGFKDDNWYEGLVALESGIDPLIPKFDIAQLIPKFGMLYEFTLEHKNVAIASASENEQYMYDVLRYCYEKMGMESPFRRELIISTKTVGEYSSLGEITPKKYNGKLQHIEIIKRRFNEVTEGEIIQNKDIVLIDDGRTNIRVVAGGGVGGYHVKKGEYFTGMTCHMCNSIEPKYMCGKCNSTYYCGVHCQRQHFGVHEKECY